MYLDCDKDALIYLGDPVGPSCHTVRHQHSHDVELHKLAEVAMHAVRQRAQGVVAACAAVQQF